MATTRNTQADDDQELAELQRQVLASPSVGLPKGADQATLRTFVERRRAQAEAYGQFVALGDIYEPFTQDKAFTAGMQVPIEHIEKWDLEAAKLVTRVASPELARKGLRFEGSEPDAPKSDDETPDKSTDKPAARRGTEKTEK